jgi:hypothetical protein
MSDFIDGDLGEGVCKDIEQHLTTCRKCRFHVDAVKFTIKMFDEWRADDMPQDAVIRLRDRLREEAGCFQPSPAGKTARKKTARSKTSRKKTARKTSRRKSGTRRKK